MYNGTAAFRTANQRAIQKHRIFGYVDDYPFTAKNILGGSLTITNQCSDSSDVKVGSVYVGKLTVTFLNNLMIPASSWKNRKIVLNFALCIDDTVDTEEWESFKLGEYFVSKADITPEGVVITAYDIMSRFDRYLPDSYIISGQASDILRALCRACEVTLGMTDIQIAQLPNGTRPLGLYTPNDCKTYRDVLFWLAQTLGGFATIDRNGRLVIRSYINFEQTSDIINDIRRVNGASFSDFATDFGSIVFDNDDGTQQRIGSQGVGATYYAGFNPFVQYGTPEAKLILRTNVFLSVHTIKYTPFRIELMSSPIYELGDVLAFTGGIIHGNEKSGVVMSITYQANRGLILQGFGADPALQDVENARDSANAAANRAAANSEVIYKDYANLTAVNVTAGGDPEKVVEIDFSTNKQTSVEMWHEFLVRTATSGTMTVTAVYYLDGEEIARKPVETFSDSADHIIDLHYYQKIDEVGSHKWEVYLETSGGNLSIDTMGAIAVLKGQGISKVDSWTGVIVLDDTIIAPERLIPSGSLSETVSVSVRELDYRIELSDVIPGPSVTIPFGSFTESVDVILYRYAFNITTEDGDYNLVTEDGDYNIIID